MATDMGIVRMYQPPTHKCYEVNTDGESEEVLCDGDMFLFIYYVVIPCSVLVFIVLLLSLIMCCSSRMCKCKKYSTLETQNNAIQMDTYNTIRRASANLRHMSYNRETPIMSRSGSMTLDRSHRRNRRGRDSCHSAPGTLLRQNRNRPATLSQEDTLSPPAYNNPPPPYCPPSDEAFIGADILLQPDEMQTSVRYEDNPGRNGAQPLLYKHHYSNEYY